jgi:hypothetical protein
MKVQTNIKAGIGDVSIGNLSNTVTVTTVTANAVSITETTSVK